MGTQTKNTKGAQRDALDYHAQGKAGKLEIVATKPLMNQRDLSLAYSPGVAFACEAIVEDPQNAARYTARSNLVGVISNGTAVLGLGDIGPLAAKPVMEGKAILFKKFSGIDAFDIEISEKDPKKLIDIIAGLEPTFGAMNLEDIKAPECFEVEETLSRRLKIPVFHDDQHGTAIIVGAAITNALKLVNKSIDQVKIVTSGAGAAALACLKMLVTLGAKRDNIWVTDIHGVAYRGRAEDMDTHKAAFAQDTPLRTLGEVIAGADVFLGLSAGGVLKPPMVTTMAPNPIIFALANPTPEITPEEVKALRSDAIVATGRSDYPNQVNNVLCFPYIFRGALDVGATTINDAMKIACVQAIAGLATRETSEKAEDAYGNQGCSFGVDYIIPKPFDHRLILEIAPAVAQAAMDSGVATRPIANFDAYRHTLSAFVYKSGMLMKPIFDKARRGPKRVVFAEGENKKVLQAIQMVLDEGLAKPIIIGRRTIVEKRVRELGLRFNVQADVDLVDPQEDPRFETYWTFYHKRMERQGITPVIARKIVRSNTTVIGAIMVARKEADALLCGTFGAYQVHLDPIRQILGNPHRETTLTALSALVVPSGTYFMADTEVCDSPTVHQLVEATLLVAEEVERFGITPRIAFLSRSNFGSHPTDSSMRMRQAVEILHKNNPSLAIEGEMQPEYALDPLLRREIFPNSRLTEPANVLMMPSGDAAKIAFGLAKELEQGIAVGPMLLGLGKPAHILTPTATARGILNMTALAVVDAQTNERNRLSP